MFNIKKSRKAPKDLTLVEKICADTWDPLYRYIYFKVQNREEAEDITQETYSKALPYMQQNKIEPEKHIGFLKTVALNVIRDKWRKNKRQGINVNFESISPAETALEDHTEVSLQRSLINNALNRLNEQQREVIQLRILEGYSTAETAKKMKKSESNIRVMQYRALQTLADILSEK